MHQDLAICCFGFDPLLSFFFGASSCIFFYFHSGHACTVLTPNAHAPSAPCQAPPTPSALDDERGHDEYMTPDAFVFISGALCVLFWFDPLLSFFLEPAAVFFYVHSGYACTVLTRMH